MAAACLLSRKLLTFTFDANTPKSSEHLARLAFANSRWRGRSQAEGRWDGKRCRHRSKTQVYDPPILRGSGAASWMGHAKSYFDRDRARGHHSDALHTKPSAERTGRVRP